MSPRSNRAQMEQQSVMVTNLPPRGVTKEGLRNLFSGYGNVLSVDIPDSCQSKYSTIAYVKFSRSAEALSACVELNNVDILCCGHPIFVFQVQDRQNA